MPIVFTTLYKSCIIPAIYFRHAAKLEKSEHGVFTTGTKHSNKKFACRSEVSVLFHGLYLAEASKQKPFRSE